MLDADGILPSYDIIVYVRDSGQPRLEAYMTYTINITTSEHMSSTKPPEKILNVSTFVPVTVGVVLLLFIIVAATVVVCAVWRKKSNKMYGALF